MKAKRIAGAFAVFWVLLCSHAWAAEEMRPEKFDGEKTLLATPNPFLKGVKKLYVIIEPKDANGSVDGLKWAELQGAVEKEVNEAGLEVVPGIVLGKGIRDREIPELRITMEMMKFIQSQVYVFRVQTAFAGKVLMPEQNVSCKAELWKTEPAMVTCPVNKMPDVVTKTILEQVKTFIVAHKAAEAATGTADANSTGAVQKEDDKKETKPAAAKDASKYKYVASKNSKVFHNADCPMGQRISAANLVGYNTKEEAVSAGKRPCKRCNP